VDHPLPWLTYVDAGDLDDERIDFDGLNVESPTGEHLGDVTGFIVDADNRRPYYVVVDAGGWFKSREYLLPIGQGRLDVEREVIVTDLSRDRIDRFPGFDKDQFNRLSADELREFNNETSRALTDQTPAYADTDHFSAAWSRPEFRSPDWWRGESIMPSTATDRARSAAAASIPASVPSMAELTQPIDRGAEIRAADTRDAVIGRGADNPAADREIDPSPHYDGRAQPGDVLGLETGGERTHVGETAEDENKRRRDAEKDAPKQRPR
jgi:hypothetical protein